MKINVQGKTITVPDGLSQSKINEVVEDFVANQQQTQNNGTTLNTVLQEDIISPLNFRKQQIIEGTKRLESGEQGLPETFFQAGGRGLQLTGDVLGNLAMRGIGEVAEPLGKIPVPANFGGGTIGSRTQDLFKDIGSSNFVQKGAGALGSLLNMYENFSTENPRLAANIESAANYALAAIPAGKSPQFSGRRLAETGKKITRNIRDIIPKPDAISSDLLARRSRELYKIADDYGGAFKPENMSRLAKKLREDVRRQSAGVPDVAKKTFEGLGDKEGDVREALNLFDEMSGQPLSLEGFENTDKLLGKLIRTTKDASVEDQLRSIQRIFRNQLEDIGADDIIGGQEGLKAYKVARDLWKKQAKIRDLELEVKKAFNTTNAKSSLKTRLGKYLIDNERFLTTAEKKAIEEALQKGGITQNLVDLFQGQFPGYVALGSGQPVLAGALRAARAGTQNIDEIRLLNKVQNVYETIAGETPRLPPLQALGRIGLKTATLPVDMGLSTLGAIYGPRATRLGTLGALQQTGNQRQQESVVFNR